MKALDKLDANKDPYEVIGGHFWETNGLRKQQFDDSMHFFSPGGKETDQGRGLPEGEDGKYRLLLQKRANE